MLKEINMPTSVSVDYDEVHRSINSLAARS